MEEQALEENVPNRGMMNLYRSMMMIMVERDKGEKRFVPFAPAAEMLTVICVLIT